MWPRACEVSVQPAGKTVQSFNPEGDLRMALEQHKHALESNRRLLHFSEKLHEFARMKLDMVSRIVTRKETWAKLSEHDKKQMRYLNIDPDLVKFQLPRDAK